MKDKIRILIDEYNYQDFPANPPKDKPNPNEMMTSFNRASDYSKKFSYEVTAEGTPASTEDAMIFNVIENFYSKHPMIQLNGVDHSGTKYAMYNLVDARKIVVTKLKLWDNKRKIADFLAESELSQLRDICYFYGSSPVGKTKGAICIELADYEDGKLFKKVAGEDKIQDFVNNFILSIDTDTEFRINCSKAIRFGIVINNPKDGRSNYYLGSTFIGISQDDVVAFFKREEQLYKEFIIRGIKEKDQFEDEMVASEAEVKLLIDKESMSFVDKEQLRKATIALYNEVYSIVGSEAVVTRQQLANCGQEKLLRFNELLQKQKEALESAKTPA